MARSATGKLFANQGVRMNGGASNARAAAPMPKSTKSLPSGGARSRRGRPFGGLRGA